MENPGGVNSDSGGASREQIASASISCLRLTLERTILLSQFIVIEKLLTIRSGFDLGFQ